MANCFECGVDAELHDHHVVPRALGGTKTVPLCISCHSKVHGKKMGHKELTIEGQRRAKDEGRVYGSVPYGFVSCAGRLTPNEAEVEMLKTARALASSHSLREIADALFVAGYRNRRGVKHNHNSVRKMLVNG